MPQQKTQQLFIYRMTHIDNVPFIAQNGLWSKLSPVHDPNFIPIGNPDIIDKRTNKFVVVIPPGGVLGEDCQCRYPILLYGWQCDQGNQQVLQYAIWAA